MTSATASVTSLGRVINGERRMPPVTQRGPPMRSDRRRGTPRSPHFRMEPPFEPGIPQLEAGEVTCSTMIANVESPLDLLAAAMRRLLYVWQRSVALDEATAARRAQPRTQRVGTTKLAAKLSTRPAPSAHGRAHEERNGRRGSPDISFGAARIGKARCSPDDRRLAHRAKNARRPSQA
jgi:hypothetical protein